jgi:2-phospho-L-lactate guanylyltransferase
MPARLLASEGRAGMVTLPGDIPLVTPAEITSLLAAHLPAPSFTIVPSHDEHGSNAIACSPPDAVPLRFGEDSFFPHLRSAEACGIRPTVLHLPGIALDLDKPEDVVSFTRIDSPTRARAVLAEHGMVPARGPRRHVGGLRG